MGRNIKAVSNNTTNPTRVNEASTNNVINVEEKLSLFFDYWSPKVIAMMNDYQFKLVKMKGAFTWHSHDETDEVFIVIKGEMSIALRDTQISLAAGEMYVVPKGVEHKPYSASECHLLLVEPSGVVNTGEAGGELTAEMDVWI
ncbi:cupin domain-containing protein [uncultured Shewanella sp.]|uniref:cupin domain-containing protein n=1 Tax=uncultured Shewanella sp. TaxID=173975 RepID=UPI00261FBFDB|nr:cupin domain-containing protein [uncultured Shewanella sp.]